MKVGDRLTTVHEVEQCPNGTILLTDSEHSIQQIAGEWFTPGAKGPRDSQWILNLAGPLTVLYLPIQAVAS